MAVSHFSHGQRSVSQRYSPPPHTHLWLASIWAHVHSSTYTIRGRQLEEEDPLWYHPRLLCGIWSYKVTPINWGSLTPPTVQLADKNFDDNKSWWVHSSMGWNQSYKACPLWGSNHRTHKFDAAEFVPCFVWKNSKFSCNKLQSYKRLTICVLQFCLEI